MKTRHLLLAVLALFITTSIQAKEQYFSLGYTDASYVQPKDDVSLPVVMATYGTKFNKYFSTELRFGFGNGEDEAQYTSFDEVWTWGDTDLKIESMFSLLLKFEAPVSKYIYPYAVIGGSQIDFEVDGRSEADITGFTWGVGTEFRLDYLGINLEFTQYTNDHEGEVYAFGLGATYHF